MYLNTININKYMIRNINNSDYNLIFKLLNQLTEAPKIQKKNFDLILDSLNKNHLILVYEQDNLPIGMITLIIEPKLIHNGKSVGHIEDLVIDFQHRHNNIAKLLIEYCIEYCKNNNCYKIILDAKPELTKFYEKFNFKNQGYCFRLDL